jgi:hypothetical protein
MSATVPFATSSLLPMVGLVSTDGPGFDSFDSDMMLEEVCEDAAVLRKSACGMSKFRAPHELNHRTKRICSQYRLLP